MGYRIECGIEPGAAKKLKKFYVEKPDGEGFVTATVEAIRDGHTHVPLDCRDYPIKVRFTDITLVVSSEGDRICKIQYIGIDDARE